MNSRDNPHFKARERETRTYLNPGSPAIIRLDGRAFHTYCRGLRRPFDEKFMADMNATAIALSRGIDGVRLAYVQSDEISLLLMPAPVVNEDEAGFMFGGAVQKLVSIGAAIASSRLNALRLHLVTDEVALFDARAFSVTDLDEARDYFAWRQLDARVNSLSMLASAHFSHKQLLGVPTSLRAAMLESRGISPVDLPEEFRNGRIVTKVERPDSKVIFDRRLGAERTVEFTRRVPVAVAAPDFESCGLFEMVSGKPNALVTGPDNRRAY